MLLVAVTRSMYAMRTDYGRGRLTDREPAVSAPDH